MLVLGHDLVRSVLYAREDEILQTISEAYLAHAAGQSVLPHSSFLRLPGDNRIIALPAYLGGPEARAGIKWIASFPGNVDTGLARASAVIVLNSPTTGQPVAVMEGSVISALRTAASAALAVSHLARHLFGSPREISELGVIGCGVINTEIVRFVRHLCAGLTTIRAFDIHPGRVERFAAGCDGLRLAVCRDIDEVLPSRVVSVATTASRPHIMRIPKRSQGSIILNISLRDLAPEVILENTNVVDDIEHVCREQTSLHLAQQATGHRDFVQATLADLLSGRTTNLRNAADGGQAVIFSPFGLGILDLALAGMVMRLAAAEGKGMMIEDFCPSPSAVPGSESRSL